MRLYGQTFTSEVLERIRAVVSAEDGLSRSALSRRVCGWLGWHDTAGKPKEVSSRKALVELERRDNQELGVLRYPILAPGLLLFIAGVVAQIDVETLIALTKFVVDFYIGGAILMLILVLLFWRAVRGPLLPTLAKLSNPNMLAFMTNNPIVALPATLDMLEEDYGVDRRVPDMVIPFGIFANQHGAVFLLSFLTLYLAQIYVIDLALQDYAVIAIGSIIAGATAVGGGPVLIPTVAPILGAVGIPTSMALVVLATTDNLIGPVRTVTSLQANITLTVMAARRGKEKPEAPADPAHAEEDAA